MLTKQPYAPFGVWKNAGGRSFFSRFCIDCRERRSVDGNTESGRDKDAVFGPEMQGSDQRVHGRALRERVRSGVRSVLRADRRDRCAGRVEAVRAFEIARRDGDPVLQNQKARRGCDPGGAAVNSEQSVNSRSGGVGPFEIPGPV